MSWVITDGECYYIGYRAPHVFSLSSLEYAFKYPTRDNAQHALEAMSGDNVWDDFTVAKLAEDTKDSGHNNPAYNLPEGVTNIYQLVTQSRMTDDVGECFRLLYTVATGGKYTVPESCKELTDLARHFNFNGFMYDAMQALYRSGTGSRNNLERDMEKAQYYVHQEWRRLEDNGDYNSWLESAGDLLIEIVGEPYVD